MIYRHPTEIDDPEWYPLLEDRYHGGNVSGVQDIAPEDKPRRKIGFVMPEKEPEAPSPDWMLL